MTQEEWMKEAERLIDAFEGAVLAATTPQYTTEAATAYRAALFAHLQQSPVTDLHAAIMNLPCDAEARLQQHNAAELFAYLLGHRDARHAAAELVGRPLTGREVTKLWLWKNFVDGKPEYWAFDNPYPCHLTDNDPQTLGEPCGYAIFKASRDGSNGRTEEQVLRGIALAAASHDRSSARMRLMDSLLTEYRHALLSRPLDTARAESAYSALLTFAASPSLPVREEPTGLASFVCAQDLAQRFHEAYERLAPGFGYTTRPETRTLDLQSANGRLMVAVCQELLAPSPSPDKEEATPLKVGQDGTLRIPADGVGGTDGR